MYENEPRLLCNYPVSGCVGIIATTILVSQILCLLWFSNWLFYFIEISLCFSLVFVLSVGVRHRKVGYVTAYCLFICTYIFWVAIDLIFFILFYNYAVHHPCPDPVKNFYQNDPNYPEDANGHLCYYLKSSAVADLVLAIISTVISILLCLVQLRFCYVLYKVMLQERQANNAQVSYQHRRPPNSPPIYQQSPAPWPEKPPGYAEAASHLPPNYINEAFASTSTATTSTQPLQSTSASTSVQPAVLQVVDEQVVVQAEEGRMATQEILTPATVFDSFVETETRVGEVVPQGASQQQHDLSDTNPFRDELTRTG